ncbi:phosphotransferase [Pedobacter cryoconitis]
MPIARILETGLFNQKYRVSWQEPGRKSWLDSVLFSKLHHRMQELFPYLPKQKSILHGDYGYDNLLLNTQHQVTAVLDWGEMLLL